MMSPVLAAASAIFFAFMASGAMAAPPEKRDFFGTVVSVGENLLEIATDDGLVKTPVSEETVIRLPLKRDAALTDLIEGDVVAVSLSDDLVAGKIFVIPRKTQFRHVAGEVTSVEDELIIVQPSGKVPSLLASTLALIRRSDSGEALLTLQRAFLLWS